MRNTSSEANSDFGTPVLVVGRFAESCLSMLDGKEFPGTSCPDVKSALTMLHLGHHKAVLCDLDTPGTGRKPLLSAVCREFPDVAVVVVTPPAKLRDGILAMIAGASGFIQSPLHRETVANGLRSALKRKHLNSAVLH